jgi:YVTN family beta-propeller protein
MKEITCNKPYRKHTLLKAFGITILAFLLLVSIAGAAPFAYVINGDLPSGINIIDTATNKVISYVGGSLTGPGNLTGPGVTVNSAGTKVYVTNSDKNTVSVISTAANKVTATVNVGSNPYGVEVTLDGKKVYVANSDSNTISVIDASTNTVTATVNVGSSPRGIVVTPNGQMAYITNFNSNTVSVIDTATNKIKATVNVGNEPEGIAVTPDGKKVYVANSGTKYVSVIDTKTNKVTSTVNLGLNSDGSSRLPNEVAITPDGKKVYVADSGSYVLGSGFVSVINASTNKVITTIEDGYFDNTGIAVTPDGKKVYVVNEGHTGTGYGVSVIDTTTNKVTGDVDSGQHFLIPYAFGKFIGSSVTPTPQKPVARFSGAPTSRKAPLTVKFTDQSTNKPTSWSWKFGDGSTSNVQNPSHKYARKGAYTVSLRVKNGVGSSSLTKSKYITVK